MASRLCELCSMTIKGGQPGWISHQAGPRHQKRLAASNIPVAPAAPSQLFCDACQKKYKNKQAWNDHVAAAPHQAKMKQLALRATLKEAESNKFSVTVTPSDSVIDLGIIPVDHWAQNKSLVIKVSAKSVRLASVSFSSNMYSLSQIHKVPIPLTAAQPLKLSIDFNFHKQLGLRGHFEDRVELRFENMALQQSFTILRGIQAIIGVQADYDLLRANAPFVRRKKERRVRSNGRFVPGPPRSIFSTIPYGGKLGKYPINPSVIVAGPDEERITIIRAILPETLIAETYARHWHTLLHVEEEQMLKLNFYISIVVPGLSESRPSVLQDDAVNVCLQRQPDVWFEGRVIKLHQTQLGLKFNKSFQYNPGDLCDVRFTITRIPLRRMHQALDIPFFPGRVLFPDESHLTGQSPPDDEDIAEIEVINPLLATNRPQMEAIAAILAQRAGTPPFVVFGPPGTGKTVTVVEAMLQLVERDSDVRILACAPSNSAADLLAERLMSRLGTDQMFRLNAPFRAVSTMPKVLLPYCFIDESDRFSIQDAYDLARYNVIVTTCMSASIPYGVGMEPGHFSYIFIDEAGQAMEPEAMVPIKTISNPLTQIILSGDPLQLGPIIRSGVARTLGLGVSYLERLMRRDIYNENIWHGITVVKLTKNFRSHEAILDFPNTQFYGSDLQVCGDRLVLDKFIGSPVLPNRKFPIVFHGVPMIARATLRRISTLQRFRQWRSILTGYWATRHAQSASPREIGVIAPYRAQTRKLRKKLGDPKYQGLKVGSVEEYQGQEREVIILTTVRTDREQVTYDLRHTLGFLVNPRRMNVAITRPKGLLIIVGDPFVLGLDPLWRKLLNYIHNNGGWTGRLPDWDTSATVEDDIDPETYTRERELRRDADMEELTRRLMDVVVGGASGSALQDGDYAEEQLETSGDRPWRQYI
ncbi:hypothetical protein FRB96_008012 [Tulasnella sp. 330]|nr:hypothetical protein FRB96_008012 [Tulasnella sp. 330]